jgi:hypothetical protein
MLDTLPQEIFQQVLRSLERKDLKALRLVNASFSRDVAKALFRRIDISCLTLPRLQIIGSHPILGSVVEEIYYHEMQLDNVGTNEGSMESDLWYLRQTITRFRKECDLLEANWQDKETVMAYQIHGFDMPATSSSTCKSADLSSMSMPLHLEDEVEFKTMMISVLDVYAQYAKHQELQSLSHTFCQYLPLLPSLRRFVSVDASAGEIARSYPFTEAFSHLDPVQEYFPLTDAGIRTSFTSYNDDWPGHGFIAMLATLNVCTALKIEHLELSRGEDLWAKRGIAITKIEDVGRALEIGSLPRAFQNLESLKLCLEVSMDEYSTWSFVPSALAMAHRLKVLEICLTSRNQTSVPLESILPMTSLPSLQAAVFEGLSFRTPEISQWLFLQSRLRSLKLRNPYLHGHWKDVLDELSEKPEFKLDCFELVSPWDHDIREYELGSLEEVRVPSRVSNEDALYFINVGGQNPFGRRHWRKFTADPDEDENMEDNLSDYSDMSEWRVEDHPSPVEDPDGPEYDEHYNFDAEEESDFEMEGVE